MTTTISGCSSTVTLAAGATFAGASTHAGQHTELGVALKTDVSGSLFIEFSSDGTNWDISNEYTIAASRYPNLAFATRVPIVSARYRVRYLNGSAAQTLMRLHCTAFTAQPTPATNGATVSRTQDLALTPHAVSSSACRLHSVTLSNTSATWSHAKFYNVAAGSVVVGTTPVALCLSCPPGASLVWQPQFGQQYSAALSCAATLEMDDAGVTAPGADLSMQCSYSVAA